MATEKQKKLAQLIVKNSTLDKPLNGGQMLEKVGYSQHLTKQPGRIIETEGVQEVLEEMGFTEENAKMVVTEIMLNSDNDANARLKATDQVFKVKGSYAPEKSVSLNMNIKEGDRQVVNQALNRYLNGLTPNTN